MAQLEYVEAGTGRIRHHAVESEVEDADSPPSLVPINWLPLPPGRFVDVPVAGSDGQTYVALPFVLPFDRQVKCLLTAKTLHGPFAATVEQIDKAIERLQNAKETLAMFRPPPKDEG